MKKGNFDNTTGSVNENDQIELGSTTSDEVERLAQLAAQFGVKLRNTTADAIEFTAESDVFSQVADKFNSVRDHWAKKVMPRLGSLKFDMLKGGSGVMLVTEKVGEILYVHPCAFHLEGPQSAANYNSTNHKLTKEESDRVYRLVSILGQSSVNGINDFERELVASDWVTAGNFINMVAAQFNVPAAKIRVAGLSEIYNVKTLVELEVGDARLSKPLRVFIANIVGRQGLETGTTPKFTPASAYKNIQVLASVNTHADIQAQSNVDLRSLPTFSPIHLTTRARNKNAALSPLATAAQDQLSVVGGFIDLQLINTQNRLPMLQNLGIDINQDHVRGGVLRYAPTFVHTGTILGNEGSERLTLPEFLGAMFEMPILADVYQNALYPGEMHNGAVDKSYDIGAIGLESPATLNWAENYTQPYTKVNTNPSVYNKEHHRQLMDWSVIKPLAYATDAMQSGEWAWLYHLISGAMEKGSEVDFEKINTMLLQAAVDRTGGRILNYYNPKEHRGIIAARSQVTPWGIYTDQDGTHDIRRKWNYLSYLNECAGLTKEETEAKMNQWALLSEMNQLPSEAREKLIVQKMTEMTDNFVLLDRFIRVFWNPVFIQAGYQASRDAGLIIETDVNRHQSGQVFVRTGFGSEFLGAQNMFNQWNAGNPAVGNGPIY